MREWLANHDMESHLWSVLDVLPYAVVLLGGDSRVLGMNARGQAMLRDADAVRFDGAFLRATDALLDQRLQTIVASKQRAVLCLRTLSRRRAPELTLVPLGNDCSAILISDPTRAVAQDAAQLRALYGLTPTEARVLAQVVQGEGGQRAADVLRMSINTLRRHLKNVFQKMQVERQSELVRVVTGGIAALNLSSS